MWSAPVDAGVPVTMTMAVPPPQPSPPEMNGGDDKGEADPRGQSGEHGKVGGEDHGNHGKGEASASTPAHR